MKNLILTGLGILFFSILICGCYDSFEYDNSGEKGSPYESDLNVLKKFVDINESTQEYYINPNKKSTILSYITNSDLEELNAVDPQNALQYEGNLSILNTEILQAISSHTVDYVVMSTNYQVIIEKVNEDVPVELSHVAFSASTNNQVRSLLDISDQGLSKNIYSGNLVETGIELNPSLYTRDNWSFRISCEVGNSGNKQIVRVFFCGTGYFSVATFNWLLLNAYDSKVLWNFTCEQVMNEDLPSVAQMVFFK